MDSRLRLAEKKVRKNLIRRSGAFLFLYMQKVYKDVYRQKTEYICIKFLTEAVG